jgi:uncharacterized protein (TIGR02646 family)
VIRIKKPKTAPEKLKKQGKAKTNAHIQEYQQSPSKYQSGEKKFSFSSDIYGDNSVKTALISAQHKKCCFCERLIGEDGDVEHFRPKSAYCQTKGERLQRPGYYWLAYDWENLYLSCGPCNQRQKRNLFPLLQPKNRAHLNNNDITHEESLFIDPGKEDPSQHIEFRGEIPYAVSGSKKGKPTIQNLKLDRNILNEARLRHLQKLRRLYEITVIADNKTQSEELKKLADEAERILQDAISDKGEFAAATRAALNNGFEYVIG